MTLPYNFYGDNRNRVFKGLITLWSGQGLKALAGCGAKPCIKPSSVSHRVNLETVSTVSKEGHALQVKAAPLLHLDILHLYTLYLEVYYKKDKEKR